MNIALLLKKIRRTTSLKSNRQIALCIDVASRSLTDWERADVYPNDKNILKLCMLAGEDPLEWMLWAHAQRNEDETSYAWNALLTGYKQTRFGFSDTRPDVERTDAA